MTPSHSRVYSPSQQQVGQVEFPPVTVPLPVSQSRVPGSMPDSRNCWWSNHTPRWPMYSHPSARIDADNEVWIRRFVTLYSEKLTELINIALIDYLLIRFNHNNTRRNMIFIRLGLIIFIKFVWKECPKLDQSLKN